MKNKKIQIGQCLELFQKYGDLGLKVKTPFGYKHIEDCQITEKNGGVYRIKTENKFFLECSKNHRIKIHDSSFKKIKDLVIGDIVQTINGNSPITLIENTNLNEDLIDIQVDEVEQYYSNGIVSHNSTISIDLLLFLFFNRTTKTKTNIDVFNKFTESNTVYVKGTILIDGIVYIIERIIERKLSRSGEFKVNNVLNFFKEKHDGSFENLSGEQRRETEKYISTAIGTEEDFLSTILSTGYNLEELIDSKPTARGQILTKFIGLENLKIKEDVARNIYNDWSKKLVSNTYDKSSLTENNRTFAETISILKDDNEKLTGYLKTMEIEIKELDKEKEKTIGLKNNDVDLDLIRVNPEILQKEINDLKLKQSISQKSFDDIRLIEPSEYYVEDDHNKLKDEINDAVVESKMIEKKIIDIESLILQMETGTICPTCKRLLEDVDHTEEINTLKNDVKILKSDMMRIFLKVGLLKSKESDKFIIIKQVYDTYENNKLIKAKYEIDIDRKKIEIEAKELKYKHYDSNKKKLDENTILDSKITILRTKIETMNGTIRQTDANINKNIGTITSYEEKIKSNLDLIKKIEFEEEYGTIFKTYLNIFGKNGISKVIMKNMIPLINQELYRLLSDSCNFILELNVNEKNEVEFIMIDTESRVSKSLESGSGYEKTIASLAIRSVLTKISSLPKPNVVVMDEIFGKIADENLEIVGEFFKKIKNYFDHILVISHNPLIRNWSDNIIMIKKENNVSNIDFITKKIS